MSHWSIIFPCQRLQQKGIVTETHCMTQCCNEDQKWTEDEDEESSGSEKRPKTKMKILWNFEKSSKTFEDRNFFEDIRRIEDFCQHIKENMQMEKYVS